MKTLLVDWPAPLRGASSLCRLISILILLLGISAAPARVPKRVTVTAEWSPVTDSTLDHYVLYYGQASGIYLRSLIAFTTTALVSVPLGRPTYFAVTAVTTDGLESVYSEEATFIPGQE